MPAANAVEASTIPGPPRAFSATPRFVDARGDSPATRAPTQTAQNFAAQAIARKIRKKTGLNAWTRSSLRPTIAK